MQRVQLMNEITCNKYFHKLHYEIEKDYAKRILLSSKNSEKRKRLFKDSYNHVLNIIEKYNPGGSEPADNPVHTSMMVSIIQNLGIPASGHILDIGCATGNLILALLKKGYQAEGIEVSNTFVEKAKKKLHSNGKENLIFQSDIVDFDSEKTFDCIIMDNVLEHIVPDTTEDVLKKCYHMLNRNGWIVINVPHKFSGPHDISYLFLPLGSTAKGFHFREFTFEELEQVMKNAGFKKILGFPVYPGDKRYRFITKKFKIKPSVWAACKAKILEKLFQVRFFKKILTINRRITQIFVKFMFPTICVGVKTED